MIDVPRSTEILVVEDDGLLRRMAVEMLTDEGFATEGVGSAAEALGYLQATSGVKLLVTDINMPGMNGLDLAHRVRDQFADVRLLIVSGGVPLASGDLPAAAEFLQKPFTVPHFLARVRDLISGSVAAER